MRGEYLDVQGEKPVRLVAVELCLDDRTKQAPWKKHYERLKSRVRLTEVNPMKGPAPYTPIQLVIKAIKLMKCGKAAGAFRIVAEMLKPQVMKGPSRSVT